MDTIRCYDSAGNPLEQLYQWDTNQTVIINGIDADAVDEVHFCSVGSTETLVLKPTVIDSGLSVEVPNILLQQSKPIAVYVVADDGNSTTHTIGEVRIIVAARAKPSDYVYTETEILHYHTLDARITELENGAGTSGTSVQLVIWEEGD